MNRHSKSKIKVKSERLLEVTFALQKEKCDWKRRLPWNDSGPAMQASSWSTKRNETQGKSSMSNLGK